jgi:hypothetical protein
MDEVFRGLLNHPDAIVVVIKGGDHAINSQFERMFGYDARNQ